MRRPPLKIFFDGGCRPNPGPMEIAVALRGAVHIDRDLGPGTGMDAEWLALIAARRLALAEPGECVLLGDALAVIDQAQRRVPARGRAADHLAAFDALGPGPVRLRHIGRAQNLAGIALARWRR
ncbi:hypothetical protein IP88_03660 [alpha proteobacterium AAP81b]|nr:hypothetical protein IP88_03660 [alpha proteobacterium AAP81b]